MKLHFHLACKHLWTQWPACKAACLRLEMCAVRVIWSLLYPELDDMFIVNYVNNSACFQLYAQTVT